MPILHVANGGFEEEISRDPPPSFPEIIETHNVYAHLQFLPFLYGDKKDFVCTFAEPDEHFFQRLEAFGITPPKQVHEPIPNAKVESWGDTLPLKRWADLHHLHYEIPPWDVIREINSKAFSFAHTPKLPHGTLLYDWKQLEEWSRSFSGEKVLKSCYGTSGFGHFRLKELNDPSLVAFTKRNWESGLPLIAEPWVARDFDFSTQWFLEKSGEQRYIGFTLCVNDEKGRYRGSIAGNPKALLGQYFEHFAAHLEEAKKLLAMLHAKNFFGHVGFDAMIYDRSHVQPIVEINGRKTMGWLAIALQKRYFPDKTLRLSIVDRKDALRSLLPFHIITSKKQKITFQRQLSVDFVD